MSDWQPYFVNIRDGVVVGTQDSDMPDGTYVRVDVLPSAGGSVWNKVMNRVAVSQTPDPAVKDTCGECYVTKDETCDICGAVGPSAKAVQK